MLRYVERLLIHVESGWDDDVVAGLGPAAHMSLRDLGDLAGFTSDAFGVGRGSAPSTISLTPARGE